MNLKKLAEIKIQFRDEFFFSTTIRIIVYSTLINWHHWSEAFVIVSQGQQDMAFTVNHPNQVLVMGHSQDLGRCAGASKAGKACTNFINK